MSDNLSKIKRRKVFQIGDKTVYLPPIQIINGQISQTVSPKVTGAKTSKNSQRGKKELFDESAYNSNNVNLEIDDNAEVAVFEKKKKRRNRRHKSAINKNSPINSIENTLEEKEIESSPSNLPEINSKKKNYRVSKQLSGMNNDYNENVQIHIKKS